MSGHAHRVNSLALSCDYICRTGAFSHATATFETRELMYQAACERYQTFRAGAGEGVATSSSSTSSSTSSASSDSSKENDIAPFSNAAERMVSASDDHTIFMWDPENSKKPVGRMTGHTNLINHIAFSPDGRYFASASFDRKVKVWDGRTGKFVATLHGHVGPVYRVCWSADSRLLVSASNDGTVKVWSIRNLKKAKFTLPGHLDEVYTVDWSPNGMRVCSGSKDRTLKIWQA